jgi:hypothetical protein
LHYVGTRLHHVLFFATRLRRREGLRAEILRPLAGFLTAKALRLREVCKVFIILTTYNLGIVLHYGFLVSVCRVHIRWFLTIFKDFDYRFWFYFTWTPHGLSMANLWSIYGGRRGSIFFGFFYSFIRNLIRMGIELTQLRLEMKFYGVNLSLGCR